MEAEERRTPGGSRFGLLSSKKAVIVNGVDALKNVRLDADARFSDSVVLKVPV